MIDKGKSIMDSQNQFSVLHVTSSGKSNYVLIDTPVVFPEIAEGLRRYLGMSVKARPASLAGYYSGTPLTLAEFNRHVLDFFNQHSDAAGVYDVDLDTGYFCTLHADRGWDRYTTRDVLYAAWQASLENTFRAREERFLTEVKQKRFARIPAPVFNHAVTIQSDDLLLTAFHVKENKEEAWYSVSGPIESVCAASALRKYLQEDAGDTSKRFSAYFAATQPMPRSDYEWYTANLLGRGDIVTQVYDLDLDRGVFSVLHGDGWKNYSVDDVCAAAYHSGNLYRVSSITEAQRFQDELAGKEIKRDNLEIYIRGDRRLDSSEILFSDEVMDADGMLNFNMDICFPPDTVLGTYVDTFENDDTVNVYANYDLVHAAVCDELDIVLWHADSSSIELKYRLRPEEKEMLLPEMEKHCRQDTGMTLAAWRERYMMECVSEQVTNGGETLSPSELAARLCQRIADDGPVIFREAVRVRIEPDEWIDCHTFREYANTMQYPDPTRVHIPQETEKLLTILVNSGVVTAWQACSLHGNYTFDDDGREALYWPEPAEALEKLGMPILAEAFRQNGLAQQGQRQMGIPGMKGPW